MKEEMLEFLQSVDQSLLFSIGIIFIVAAFFAYIARIFKQPLIPAYIIAGLVLGPIGLKLIQDVELIQSISEIGIVFLLFIVGLEMDLQKLKKLGSVTVITGVLQVILTFAAGYAIALLLGFDQINAVYAGLILAFSSTMIVIKLLSDEDELNTLHGRIILGVLFIQDIIVIIALTVLLSADSLTVMTLLTTLEKFIALLLAVYVLNRFIVHSLFKFAAKSSELLFLLSVAVCFLFSLGAYLLDFSIAIGAFLGGITLANLPYNLNLIARISSLKDFFATIFFVSLGLQLVFVNISTIFFPLFIFLLVIILLKPIIVMIILSFLGYDKRNAFVSSVLFSITILLGVISIALTAYIMKYELSFYTKINYFLSFFEKLSKRKK